MSELAIRHSRRRVLSMFGAGLGAVALAACSTSQPPATPVPANPAAPAPTTAPPAAPTQAPTAAAAPAATASGAKAAVSMTFWSFPVGFSADWPHGKWEAQQSDKYATEHAGVKIEMLPLGWEAIEKLQTSIAGGSPPDILGRGAWAYLSSAKKSGVLQEVEVRKDLADDLVPGYLKAMAWEGKSYMIPWYVLATGARVNLTASKAGSADKYLPTAPEYKWNWNQYLEYAKQVATAKTSNGQPVYAAAFFTQTTVPAYHWVTCQWLWNMGADLYDPATGGAGLHDDVGVKALQYLQDLYTVHKVIPNPINVKDPDVGNFWNQGSLGYATGTSVANAHAKGVTANNDTGVAKDASGIEWRLVQNPTASGVPHQGWGGPGLDVNLVPFKQKDSNKLDVVIDFGHYMVSPENQAFMAQFQIPVRQSVAAKALKGDAFSDYTNKYLVPNARVFTSGDNDLKLRETFHNHFQDLFLGKSAKQVAAEYAADANALLAKQ